MASDSSNRAAQLQQEQEHAEGEGVRLTDAEKRRRHWRSVAIAWGLVALAFLFFIATIVKLASNAAHMAHQ